MPTANAEATTAAMLRLFGPECTPAPIDPAHCTALPESTVWIDLLEPTKEEERLAEKLLGTNIPTREELAEIEPSSRLYQKRGAAFMTMSVLFGVGDGQPDSDAVGFILNDKHVVTVRYIDPKPFVVFAEHVYAEPEIARDPKELLVRLLDAIVDRLADEFEVAGKDIETISRRIFQRHAHRSSDNKAPEMRLEAILMRIGKVEQLLAKLRETSVSTLRLLTFLQSLDMLEDDATNRRHVKSLVADADALNDHSNFLGDNLTFLLDATLGLISLEQNNVMKVFSVFAVIFMPPTLIAGVYGMNFEHMPELKWIFGYPFALALMLASAIIPFMVARRRGWL
ncbi:magnesium transporter CorA family protein [Sphingomonas rhizophila]|uniref:Magnesium transport protein CorA n=1 Tax=Sphingomonas rhizophila TaxID=2071607 RepID=A0A7G9SB41_9SPHN|nr:magnesium transporter CorA family protein [Sphingomonas rhizophila]QNN65066.1 magnesium transporter CorA family protein [Sphingomonas rhizophila]